MGLGPIRINKLWCCCKIVRSSGCVDVCVCVRAWSGCDESESLKSFAFVGQSGTTDACARSLSWQFCCLVRVTIFVSNFWFSMRIRPPQSGADSTIGWSPWSCRLIFNEFMHGWLGRLREHGHHCDAAVGPICNGLFLWNCWPNKYQWSVFNYVVAQQSLSFSSSFVYLFLSFSKDHPFARQTLLVHGLESTELKRCKCHSVFPIISGKNPRQLCGVRRELRQCVA